MQCKSLKLRKKTLKLLFLFWTMYTAHRSLHDVKNRTEKNIALFAECVSQVWISTEYCTGFENSKETYLLPLFSLSFPFTSFTLRIGYWKYLWVGFFFNLLAYIFPLNETIPTLFSFSIFLHESEAVNTYLFFDFFRASICAFTVL